jgi:NADPH:quinone reductase
MKAMVIVPEAWGGAYELQDVPEPQIGPRELLVRVRATALNRADISRLAGRYRQEATARPGTQVGGLESAGEVVAVGAQVTQHRVGNRVMAMSPGGFAELLAIDERIALPVPDRLDWPEAAATPVGMMTAHDAIATRAGLRVGESVIIHGAASAVGLMGVQIAALLGAHPVLTTITREHKAKLVRNLGADVVIDLIEQDFEHVVAEHTERGVDVVIDHVGGFYLADSLAAMAVGGRFVSIGRLGAVLAEIDLDLLARKNLTVIGTSFRTRTIEQHAEVARRAAEAVLPAIADGRVRPVVDSVFPLEEAHAAHDHMVTDQHTGKIVLAVGGN